MTDEPLFDLPGDEPHAVARAGDPDTSWAAARSVTDIRKSQADVMRLFRLYGAMTDEETAERARAVGVLQSPSGLRTRRKELVGFGLLRDSGEKSVTASGRGTIIWTTTEGANHE